jgi:hypothetical protein
MNNFEKEMLSIGFKKSISTDNVYSIFLHNKKITVYIDECDPGTFWRINTFSEESELWSLSTGDYEEIEHLIPDDIKANFIFMMNIL